MWCESHGLCVSRTVYDITFPYLECMQVLERGTGTCAGESATLRLASHLIPKVAMVIQREIERSNALQMFM